MRSIFLLLLLSGLSGCAVSPEQASQQSDNEVCESYGVFSRSGMWGAAAETYRREIERRKLMTAEEWSLSEKKTIRIGMSRCAMYASWGKPDRENRSVGSYGEHIQHVYNSGYRYIRPKYVYTRNGKVSSWQD